MNMDENLLIGFAESLFSRFRKQEADEEAASATAEADTGANAGRGAAMPGDHGAVGNIPLPGMEPIGGGPADAEAAAAPAAEAARPPRSVSLGGLLSGLLRPRKAKEKIAEEVRVIDEQLNNVLQESEEINVLGMPPEIASADAPLSQGRGMRELDLEMGEIQPPTELIKPEELRLEPSTPLAAPAAPEQPPQPAEDAASAEKKKADEAQKPLEPEPMKMPDIVDGAKKDVSDDLLSDLEQSAKEEDQIDMSIMKEYQDMPITCVELEADLKSILDQITINTQNKRNAGT